MLKMMLLLLLSLTLMILNEINSYKICNVRMLSCNNFKQELIPINNIKKVLLGSLLVSSSLISMPQSLIAAGLPDFDSEMEVKAISTVTTTSNNAIKVITTKSVQSDKKSSSSISDDDDDDLSYSNSLAREQKKQEARKKSKSARSKDLCETLGRGC
jgi:hypothetical protein